MRNEDKSQNKNTCFSVVGGTANHRETDLEIKLKWYTFGIKYWYTFGVILTISFSSWRVGFLFNSMYSSYINNPFG